MRERTRGRLERNKAKVLDALIAGQAGREIARQFKVTESAVRMFKQRHQDVLAPALAEVVKATVDVAVRDKEERIRRLAAIADKAQTAYLSDEARLRDMAPLMREERAAYRDIAEELGQLPKGDVNIDARTQVLIRSYDTWPEQLK